jgi:hypothetical protein
MEKGSFLDAHFGIRGGSGNPNIFLRYARSAYVIEETTGEKFAARKFVRIGPLGQKHLDEGPISFARIDNAGGKIKKASRITFVIRGLRQERIVVEE